MFKQTLVTTQRVATIEPTVASEGPATTIQDLAMTNSASEALPLLTLDAQQNEAVQQRRYRKPSSFRIGLFRILRVVNKIFSSLLRVLLIVFGIIGVVILFAIIASIILGSVAANGAVIILIGNGVLRITRVSHYTTNKVAAEIGAVGSLVTPVGLLRVTLKSGNGQAENKPSWVTFIATVFVGTLTGALGAAILKYNQVDLHGMDVGHAARTGALGGAILGPGSIFIVHIVSLALGITLSPFFIVAMCGIGWIQAKLSESWTDNSRNTSICYRVGTYRDDPEVNADID